MTEIEFRQAEIGWLKPDRGNARTHSSKQIGQISGSIAENGFVNPILANPEGVIIAGHGRLRAARKLQLTTVPVIVINGLSGAQERRLRLADNKTACRSQPSWEGSRRTEL